MIATEVEELPSPLSKGLEADLPLLLPRPMQPPGRGLVRTFKVEGEGEGEGEDEDKDEDGM
jgi:hypothetical protein